MSLIPTRVVILSAFLSSFLSSTRYCICLVHSAFACVVSLMLVLHFTRFILDTIQELPCLDFLFARARDLRCTF